MEILVGTDPKTGLPMYRECDYFIGGVKEPKITVFYYQWLLSPGGARLEEMRKKYVVVDVLAITEERNVLDGEGNITGTETVETSPASLGYTDWRNKLIVSQYVGLRLGEDLILGTINNKLANMPFDAIDNYIGN